MKKLVFLFLVQFFIFCCQPQITQAQESDLPTPPPEAGSVEKSFVKLDNGLLPNDVVKTTRPLDNNIFQSLLDKIKSFFGFIPIQPSQFTPNVDTQHQATLPIKNDSTDIVLKTSQDAASQSGVLSVQLPSAVTSGNDTICKGAQQFDFSTFPKNVAVVGRDCN